MATVSPTLSLEVQRRSPTSFRSRIFLILGGVNVALGTAGIFLPLLPTTPFLLLAAYLFAKSSRRWHDWLLGHPRLGPYIHAFRSRNGLTAAQKRRIALSMTFVLALSAYLAPPNAVRYLLFLIWGFWLVVLLRMKTVPESTTDNSLGPATPDDL